MKCTIEKITRSCVTHQRDQEDCRCSAHQPEKNWSQDLIASKGSPNPTFFAAKDIISKSARTSASAACRDPRLDSTASGRSLMSSPKRVRLQPGQ